MDNNNVMKKAFRREIRLDLLAKVIWRNRKKYILPLSIAFVCSAFYAFSLPRYYSTRILLAPEYSSGSSLSNSSLGGLASMAGLNLGSMSSEDAIQPEFYPDLMRSTDFLVSLCPIKVKTLDGEFSGSLSQYLQTKQKAPWWLIGIGAVKSLFAKPEPTQKAKSIDPFSMTKMEYDLTQFISGSISCVIDQKTNILTLETTAQDPLVAATLADSVKEKLQEFVTDYRTRKARNDLKHFESLLKEAKTEYMKSQKAYASFSDANSELVLQSYKSKADYLENEMQLSYNVYSQMSQQVQMAKAKLQERVPAFTSLQNSTVPIKPAGPKRMIIVISILLLTFIGYSIYLFIKEKE